MNGERSTERKTNEEKLRIDVIKSKNNYTYIIKIIYILFILCYLYTTENYVPPFLESLPIKIFKSLF